jgi:hypothetical protein
VETIVRNLAVAILLLSSSQAIAQDQPARRVAVVNAVKFTPIRSGRNLPEHERFDTTFELTLREAGWTVVQTQSTCPVLNAECLASIGEVTGTGYVVRITGEGNVQYGYNLNLEASSTTTAHTENVAAYCDTCTPARIAEIAGRFAIERLNIVLKDEQPAQTARKHSERPTIPAPTQPTEPDRNLVAPPTVSPASHISWIPWTLLGVGTATMIYGGWALYEDGRSKGTARLNTGEGRYERYSSQSLGIATLTAGGALAIAATVWLLIPSRRSTALAVSPDGVLLSGRF